MAFPQKQDTIASFYLAELKHVEHLYENGQHENARQVLEEISFDQTSMQDNQYFAAQIYWFKGMTALSKVSKQTCLSLAVNEALKSKAKGGNEPEMRRVEELLIGAKQQLGQDLYVAACAFDDGQTSEGTGGTESDDAMEDSQDDLVDHLAVDLSLNKTEKAGVSTEPAGDVDAMHAKMQLGNQEQTQADRHDVPGFDDAEPIALQMDSQPARASTPTPSTDFTARTILGSVTKKAPQMSDHRKRSPSPSSAHDSHRATKRGGSPEVFKD